MDADSQMLDFKLVFDKIDEAEQEDYYNIIDILKAQVNDPRHGSHFVSAVHSALFHNELDGKVVEMIRTDQKNKLRFFELMVLLSVKSPLALRKSRDTGFMSLLLDEIVLYETVFTNNDLYFDLIEQLAATPHGAHYLQEFGFLDHLRDRLSNMMSDSVEALSFYPKCFHIFASVGRLFPDLMLNSHREVLDEMMELSQTSNRVLFKSVLLSFGTIGKSLQGKRMLFRLENFNDDFLTKLGRTVAEHYLDIRLIALETFADLLNIGDGDTTATESSSMACEWYRLFMGHRANTTKFLFSLIDVYQVDDLSVAALNVIKMIANYFWGHRIIANEPDLLSFLLCPLDRKLMKERADVIRQLMMSSISLSIHFEKETIDEMKHTLDMTGKVLEPVKK